ncbi:hypothetical protein Dimus_002564 [Dionaea muscipula]
MSAMADWVQESAWSISSMVNAVAMAVSSVVDAWWTAMKTLAAMVRALSVVGAVQRRAGRAPPARDRQETGEGARRRGSGDGSVLLRVSSVVDDGFTMVMARAGRSSTAGKQLVVVQRRDRGFSTVVLAPPRRCRAMADGVQESAWSVSSMVNAVVMVVSSVRMPWWTAMEDAGKRWCVRSPWSAQCRGGRTGSSCSASARDGRRRSTSWFGDGSVLLVREQRGR